MSNIQELIDTVQAEGLQTRDILSTEFSWFEYMNDNLVAIRESIVSIQERMFTFFDEEQARFEEAQRDLKAARRAEAERLKEAGARGFTTPAKTSDGQVAETPTQGGGLLSGLGLAGLVAGLGAAVAGYFAGLTTALAKGLISVTKSITALFKIDNLLPDRKTLTAPFSNFFKGIKEFGKAFGALVKADDMKLFYDAQQKFGRFSGVATRVAGFVDKLIKFFAPLGEVTKLLPSGGKFLESIKTVGSKLGGIFNVFAKIAVPLTAIIAAVKAIFGSFKEFDDDMGFFEKLMITIKNLFKEIVSGFVTMPLEFIKDGISAIAGWLGFDGVKEFLDSFDIDQMFRDSVDFIFNSIRDAINFVSDLIYQGKRKLGLGDVDPEAEARIAQREVEKQQKELEKADEDVAAAIAKYEANPQDITAQRELDKAIDRRESVQQNLQEAQAGAQEAQVYTRTALDETTQDASLQAAEDSGLYDEVGFGNSRVDKDVLAQTTDVNQLKAIINDQDISTEDKRLVLNRIEELSADQNVQPRTGIKRGMEIGGPPVELSERGQAAVEAFEGDGVPDYNPETGRRGAEIGAPEKKVAGIVVERNGQPVPLTPEQVERVQFANEMATITSESNQPYDVSVNPIVAANQTATGDQISTVSNQTATGDQISTVASAPTSVDLSGIDFSQASSSQEVRQLVKDAGGDRSMQNSARMLYDAGINSQLIQTAVGTGVEVSKSTLGRPETISQLIQGGMERSEVYRLARDMGVQDPNTVVDMGVNMAMRAVPQPTATPADEVQPQPTAAVLEPRVEPLSDLTNVTNINQATTAMQSALASIIPSEAGDLNIPGQEGIDEALSPAGIMGAGLGAVVDGVKNLTSLPVGQASQEVAAAKDKPPVVAMGGSTTSIQNNVSSPNVHNYGSMSARSNDLSAQRLKDHMMA